MSRMPFIRRGAIPFLMNSRMLRVNSNTRAPRVPFISNLTGEPMTVAPDKAYWRRHLREAVRFADGMSALSKFECRTFLEIGAHPVLLPPAQVCLGASGKSAAWIASLDRQKSDADAINAMLVALYLAGHKINWSAVHADAPRRRIPLPTYPFQRQRHWVEDRTAPSDRSRSTVEPAPHPLVGALVEGSAKEARYEARYGTEHINYFLITEFQGPLSCQRPLNWRRQQFSVKCISEHTR